MRLNKEKEIWTAVIMCGGMSSRMGSYPKQFLQWGEQTFLEKIAGELTDFEEVVLSGREEINGIRCIPDIQPNLGPMGGIYSTLLAARGQGIFVVACDMPKVSRAFVRYLMEHFPEEYDCLIPVAGGREHPLCAVYKKSVLPVAEALISRQNYKMKALLLEVRTKYLEIPEEYRECLDNINTPEELNRLRSRSI